jgi:hypothetical protein
VLTFEKTLNKKGNVHPLKISLNKNGSVVVLLPNWPFETFHRRPFNSNFLEERQILKPEYKMR